MINRLAFLKKPFKKIRGKPITYGVAQILCINRVQNVQNRKGFHHEIF